MDEIDDLGEEYGGEPELINVCKNISIQLIA
jgi:hypothetical protein